VGISDWFIFLICKY